MSLQANGNLHISHQPLLLYTLIHHIAHNGLLIFIMPITYTMPNGVMYSTEHKITPIAVHNQTHQMFSLSVVFSREKRKKKRVKILCIACQGHGNLSNHMSSISSRMHLLSLEYRYRKRPSRLFLYI